MKRALLLSIVGHGAIFGIAWLGMRLLPDEPARLYPRTVTAQLLPAQLQPEPLSRKTPAAPAREEPPKAVPRPAPEKPALRKPVERPERKRTPSRTGQLRMGGLAAPPTTGMKIDQTNFPFPEYLALVQHRIEQQWRPPPAGATALQTTVYFRILPDGTLTSVRIESTSGALLMDRAALQAVQLANPLPPLPDGAGIPHLGVHFDFVSNP